MGSRQEQPHVVTRPSCSGVRTEERVWAWDPAGGSFVIRGARVTSTAVQAGAESARVMSVTDVSTEHTNHHRATDRAPRATGRRDRVQPTSHYGARRPFRGAEIDPGRLLPRCSERGHKRVLGSKSP